MKETNLGIIVKKLRETKGMSRGELSEAVGISESHLRKIEAGHRLPVTRAGREYTMGMKAVKQRLNLDNKCPGRICICVGRNISM